MAVTIPATIVANILEGAVARGADPAAILARASLPGVVGPLEAPDFVRLVRAVTLTLDDELAGLQDRPQRIGTHAIMAAHVSHAETLGAAYARAAGFMDLMDNSFRYSLRESGANLIFEMTRIPGREVLNNAAVEMVLVLVSRMLAWLVGNRGALNGAWFDYVAPGHVAAYRAMFQRAPMQFGQCSSGLAIPLALTRLPVLRSEDQATAYARRTPLDAFLPQDATTGLPLEVAVAVEACLSEQGRLPDMAQVARDLNLAPHTLRRRLKGDGVDYSNIRKQVRRDMAVRLLATTGDSVESIAAQTGFSEASAFIRAFRSWTGLTPRAYRKSEL
ncbi:transcriptional regulator, AraC family (plasmid) [Ruegeria pomeroyi DSS-3]|uniref:Transcriptional regulator, AraC family n=2 Tax=Ruegeria pomeroyi TaxID=89184 RepID=Q5LKF5_RUEPO|nr:AraC family transcriptional regulator [Ruegeria pomeroyi]AAV97557.1 transcriptional regulator, AraC family [Ruegeria pomeroyi DSS-3]NVK95517.1 AraC family transcriptional regulator ligand-binding domain-containing protein [Ruegeria pomeroyi]NVK99835.1 AraC family transcriptional regulator ligand-binding domain-containing protein [Ruegeria pomeroyi]HCE71282.1 AraC family transcriptional regulator [Ruegeria sp.]